MPDYCEYYVAKLELKRVQHYLFKVPRLSIMLGANVRLGEVTRGVWNPKDSSENPFGSPDGDSQSLPQLAVECGAQFPGDDDYQLDFEIAFDELTGGDLFRKLRIEHDPLKIEVPQDDPREIAKKTVPQDDPWEIAKKTGVLVRDASRLEAIFPKEKQALDFAKKAKRLISQEIPGATLDITLSTICDRAEGNLNSKLVKEEKVLDSYNPQAAFDFADGMPCQLSPHEMAEDDIKHKKQENSSAEKIFVTASVKAQHAAAIDFNSGKSKDVLGLMHHSIFSQGGDSEKRVTEFKDLAKENLLAVIHADGNRVGKRVQQLNKYVDGFKKDDDGFKKASKGSLLDWALREAMFFRNRQGIRCAIADAVKGLFEGGDSAIATKEQVASSIRMLMLGGDDILIVCDARLAIPFVVEMCRKLDKHTGIETKNTNLAAAYGGLSVGVGIALIQPKFPFHQAHHLAEELAGSAKRLAASHPNSHVVDWMVVKSSAVEDLAAIRRRDYTNSQDGQQYLLTRRPYKVLGDGHSLEKLWKDAKELHECGGSTLARSQFRSIEDSFNQGAASAVIATSQLPLKMRQKLEELGYLTTTGSDSHDPLDYVWSPAANADGSSIARSTQMVDVMELFELARMPRFGSKIREAGVN